MTHGGNLVMDAAAPVVSAISQIGHDAPTSVSGDVSVRTGGNATLSAEAIIGHTTGGAYPDGNTFFGVGEVGGAQTLTAAAGSQLNSAPAANGGELRIYLPGLAGYQLEAGALLNGAAAPGPGVDPLPNFQGEAAFGLGPYAVDLGAGNFGFYTLVDPPPPQPQPFEFDLRFDSSQTELADQLKDRLWFLPGESIDTGDDDVTIELPLGPDGEVQLPGSDNVEDLGRLFEDSEEGEEDEEGEE